MATLIGGIFSCILVYLLSILIEWLIAKRLFDTPAVGIAVSGIAATLLLTLAYVLGNADPGEGAILYVAAGVIVTVGRLLLRRRADARGDSESLEETFPVTGQSRFRH